MVQQERLISRRMSSITGSLLTTLMFLHQLSAKPSFFANRYMISWSVLHSNSGWITRSRHWIERFEAVTEPWHLELRGRRQQVDAVSRPCIEAVMLGYGSITTSMSSFCIAFFMSGRRVWLFGAWPQ
jgi:hypothetical protein